MLHTTDESLDEIKDLANNARFSQDEFMGSLNFIRDAETRNQVLKTIQNHYNLRTQQITLPRSGGLLLDRRRKLKQD